MDNQFSYDRKIPETITKLSREHRKVLEWVGKNKKVLETACHTGYFSAWLQKQGCITTGAEIYEPALQRAKPFLARSILGDIEKEQVWNEIAMEKYDVVLYMHILEHLVNPEQVLLKTKEILVPDGAVIICLPNISNWANRWQMFKGNFEYTETGVMDKTHLRFYNYFTAIEMIEKCGFQVDEYCGDSWRVRFQPLPEKRILWRINNFVNKVIYKYGYPNFTDKVLMFKVSF